MVRYVAVYPAAMGLFASVVLIITWNLNNQASRKEKGLAMMVMNVVGQCGPLIGVNMFPDRDAPHFVSGMVVSGLFMSAVVLLSAVLRWKLGRMNAQTEGKGSYEMVSMQAHQGGDRAQETEEAEGLIGGAEQHRQSRSPFRYML